METRSRRRKLAAVQAPAPAAAEAPKPKSALEDQDPSLAGADGGAGDSISQLPDGVLGDIISLLPTKEGARTQILASRWRHQWRSAPLNLDHLWLCRERNNLDAVVSRILAAHRGPGRRFSVPVYHLVGDRAATADAWLRSPALDDLQELDLCSFSGRLPFPPLSPQPPPAAAFRFSETLRVATIGECHLPDTTAQLLHFPKLKKLELEGVHISESSLHTIIAACPALECLLVQSSFGFYCLRINSISLRSIGGRFDKLIIENAPCLERLLQLGSRHWHPHISVVSAPKLETLGCLSSNYRDILAFDLTVIQGSRVNSLTTVVRTVKILAVDMDALSMDVVIDLMRCFPCLEKFYIEVTILVW
uniref:Uncharacterized protein n=1 Tax=Avena sativa TaxID=4498 RepID=A0ACD5TZW3_AVESA